MYVVSRDKKYSGSDTCMLCQSFTQVAVETAAHFIVVSISAFQDERNRKAKDEKGCDVLAYFYLETGEKGRERW